MPVQRRAAAIAMAAALLSAPAVGSPLEEARPNLVPLSPYHIHLEPVLGAEDGPPFVVRFSTTVANRSDVALDILAEVTDETDAPALQCVRWAGPYACVERRAVGRFAYSEDHLHFHLLDFALYELRALLSGSQEPDMSAAGLVAGGAKEGFCLQDTGRDPDAEPNLERSLLYPVGNPLYAACTLRAQGISPGWTDTYHEGLFGQEIATEGVPDGTYALVVSVDPDEGLAEAPRDDNVAFTVVTLSASGSQVSCPLEPERCSAR